MALTTTLPVTAEFTADYLEYYQVLPLEAVDGSLRIATSGQPAREVLDDLSCVFGGTPVLVQTEPEELLKSIRELFSDAQSTATIAETFVDATSEASGSSAAVTTVTDAEDLANQPPVVRYVSLLLKEANEARASDIHVEVTDSVTSVRFRIDGVLTAATAPPPAMQAAVVSRLKLIADLDIAERRVPQDGRIRVRLSRSDLDLRVSSAPTFSGESLVLRLLHQGGAPEGLEALGMSDLIRDRFAAAALRSTGLVLATGPTGSGKTTTLYSALQVRDARREKIITIEDPVEYRLPGVTQIQVNRKAGMTFSSGLRSVLRQDPDVIMVGELRDEETARIALQAAMTGHVVFATVHTNDAASAITRLVDLGVPRYLIAATLRAVLAQRLVRRVCGHCSDWTDPGPELLELCSVQPSGQKVKKSSGCALCRQTGFQGRVGLFELLVAGAPVRSAIAAGDEEAAIRRIAIGEGMVPMRADGCAKIRSGLTTTSEVLRVVDA